MSKFPLYDSLSKDISNEDLSILQKRTFIKRIDKMDINGHELVYALIKMYHIQNDGDTNTSFSLPYNGITADSNIHFDLDNMPKKLKQILFKFVSKHLEKMKEEKQFNTTPVKRI